MSSPDSCGTTGRRSCVQTNQVPFTPDITNMLPKSSPRFGALSHHSFFSRHNPHPHRVRHIQGLNGRPVCMVRDDWFVTSSLFPHPLLKSHVLRRANDASSAFPLSQNLYGISIKKNKSAQFSEAWRDELKDLASRVVLSSQSQQDRKEVQSQEEFVHRKTQYSAVTGRIVPPSTCYRRRSHSLRSQTCPQPFQDQELMVFELLCQILQTDSLSAVQQWLLLAGQREKDLVMGMIKQALDGVDLSGHQQQLHAGAPPSMCGPSFHKSWRKPQTMSSRKKNSPDSDEKPERIGDAEVLEIHTGDENSLQDHPPQSV